MSGRTADRVKYLQELKNLRNSKKTRLQSYQLQEERQLFDEVDDDQYKKILRARLDEDDFVVDDNGEGYADHGLDDWAHRDTRSEEDGSESDQGVDKRKELQESNLYQGKRKRDIIKAGSAEDHGTINKYFNQIAQPTSKVKTASNAEDKAFMDDLLGEFDDVDANISKQSKKKARFTESNIPKRPRKLSPPSTYQGTIHKSYEITQDDRSPSHHSNTNAKDISRLSLEDETIAQDSPMNDISGGVDAIIPGDNDNEQPMHIKSEVFDDMEEELDVKPIISATTKKSDEVNISATRNSRTVLAKANEGSQTKTEPVDTASWNSIAASLNTRHPNVDEKVQSNVHRTLEGGDFVHDDGSFLFFWMDYTEISGSLCLFGKIMLKTSKQFVSALVKVDGIMRKLFFLPRETRVRRGIETDEEVEMTDVYQEVGHLFTSQSIDEWKGKSCKRKYAFEIANIPRECDYLKVLYPYTSPALPEDIITKGETFSHVFGTNTALFEQFVLAQNIMGPCWLRIESPDLGAIKNVAKPSFVTQVQEKDAPNPPPLTLMSISLRTKLNQRENKQEILAISGRIYEGFHLNEAKSPEDLPVQSFTIIRPKDSVFPAGFQHEADRSSSSIRVEKSESALLMSFLAKLQISDPDVLIGHQLDELIYSIFLNRLKECKTPHWHRIGRMRRNQWPASMGRAGHFAERQLVAGRLMCDLANDLGKSLMNKCQSWSLSEMCELILNKKRVEIDNENALKSWANTGKGLLDYINHSEVDAHFIAAIALKVQMLPLAKQLTNLAGNSWARTMSGTRAERNEYILLHEFTRNKYICPDKIYNKGKGNLAKQVDEENVDNEEGQVEGKKKDKFKGGLVLEPEKGLYDKFVLVMDFNSLYPSIIQEYNICFTTVERGDSDEDKIPDVPEDQTQGVLPKLISTLVQRRRQVKSLMKDKHASPSELAQWDIKQQALKLTANSMYGCLGYILSRFYARPLAMLTTFKGREILMATKTLAETMQLRVIYGDTDSVMINTNVDNYMDAYKMGLEFKKHVNDRYRLLEIDIDNVFQRLLLHSKKKYAALNYAANGNTTMEVKGLDMKRREYCQLSKEISASVLKEILSGEETDVVVEKIHDLLRELAGKIRDGQFQPNKFVIYTKLSKDPESYPGGRTMPQVQVALRRKAKGEMIRANDVIQFIVTGDANSTISPAERAYSPQEVQADKSLIPDSEWYLVKQIFPPIERLCGPIDGTDSMRLAECLGLDTRKYQIVASRDDANKELNSLESSLSDEDRFQNVKKLSLKCPFCRVDFILDRLDKLASSNGVICLNSDCGLHLAANVVNALVDGQIRDHTNRYYEAWLTCDDASCGNRTRQMSVYGKRCLGSKGLASGCLGVMNYEYTDKMLYNQLLYFRSLFDIEKIRSKTRSDERDALAVFAEHNRTTLETNLRTIDSYLKKCGRQWVQMDTIFAFAS